MKKYTKTQLAGLFGVAVKAYSRVSAAVKHDPDLSKADQSDLGRCVSLVQGSLLDLQAEIERLITNKEYEK